MRNIPVWGKITLGLAVASLITLAIAAVGYMGILRTENALTVTAQRRLPAQIYLLTLRNALTGIQRAERTRLIPETQENPALLQRQKDNMTKYWAQAQAAMTAFEALPGPGGKVEAKSPAWLTFKEAWEAWGGRHKKVLEFLDSDMRFGAMALSMREAREAANNVDAALEILLQQERAETQTFVGKALPRAHKDQMELLAAAALAMIFSLGFGALVTTNINKPLKSTLAFAERVAGGDLAAELAVNRRDEFGKMSLALRIMVQELQKEIALAGECRLEAESEAERARIAVAEAHEAGIKAELSRRDGMRQAAERMAEVVDRLGASSQQLSAQVEQSAHGAIEQSRLSVSTAGAMERLLTAVAGAETGAARAAETADSARDRASQGERPWPRWPRWSPPCRTARKPCATAWTPCVPAAKTSAVSSRSSTTLPTRQICWP
jgi:methyl-accepting chemotaxis protein